MPRPRCFFSITINGVPSGRIVFELFSDECPKTCENFRYLCTGEKGEGKTTFKPLHYNGTPIHRIVKGFIIQGGDFSNGDGTGGESIYGGMFEDENLKLKHDKPFLLSMANKGPDTNGSQFFITTRPAPHLDGLHVVFGHVIQGKQYVSEIENQKVDANHRPYADVRIANCGELVLLKAGKIVKTKRRRVEVSSESSSSEDSSQESSSSDSESSSSEEERKRRRKQKKRKLTKDQKKIQKKKKKETKKGKMKAGKNTKRKKKERLSPSSFSNSRSPSVAEETLTMEEVVTSTIATDEDLPPEIVSTTRSWLYRYSKSPSPKEEKGERRKQPQETIFKHRDNQLSSSGRKLKGRGLMRYRTPPRYGDSTNWRYQSDRKGSRERISRRQHSPSPRRNRSMSPSARRHKVVESTQRYAQRRRDAEYMSRGYSPSRSRSAERCSFDSVGEGLSLHKKHRRECSDHDEIRRSSKWGDKRIIPAHSSSPFSKRSSQHKLKYGQASPERPQRSTSPEDSTSSPTSRKLTPSKQTSHQHKYHSDSDHTASSPSTSNVLPSKWARHCDSENDSTCTSDEDRELEIAYQQAQRSQSTSDKDIFGIAELSHHYFNN